jgi:hypothetical protein
MSVTHPEARFAPVQHGGFAAAHPQLTPFLVAVAIFLVSATVAMSFTGLP